MNDTRNVTQNCEQDVDQQISTTSTLEEYTKRRQDDGKNDLADIAVNSCQLLFQNAILHLSGPAYLAVKGILIDFDGRRWQTEICVLLWRDGKVKG